MIDEREHALDLADGCVTYFVLSIYIFSDVWHRNIRPGGDKKQ